MVLTLQETFDLVVTHLRKQGAKSAIGGDCLYRGPNGLKCAAGCLIPDNMYMASYENKAANHEYLIPLWNRLGHDTKLVWKLQVVHDSCDNWEKGFKAVADQFGLNYTAIDNTEVTNEAA